MCAALGSCKLGLHHQLNIMLCVSSLILFTRTTSLRRTPSSNATLCAWRGFWIANSNRRGCPLSLTITSTCPRRPCKRFLMCAALGSCKSGLHHQLNTMLCKSWVGQHTCANVMIFSVRAQCSVLHAAVSKAAYLLELSLYRTSISVAVDSSYVYVLVGKFWN